MTGSTRRWQSGTCAVQCSTVWRSRVLFVPFCFVFFLDFLSVDFGAVGSMYVCTMYGVWVVGCGLPFFSFDVMLGRGGLRDRDIRKNNGKYVVCFCFFWEGGLVFSVVVVVLVVMGSGLHM